jgi:hypothetical protein
MAAPVTIPASPAATGTRPPSATAIRSAIAGLAEVTRSRRRELDACRAKYPSPTVEGVHLILRQRRIEV